VPPRANLAVDDQDLEERYIYGRFLLTKLPRTDRDARLDLDGDVQRRYYRLQRTANQTQIGLGKGMGGALTGTGAIKDVAFRALVKAIYDEIRRSAER